MISKDRLKKEFLSLVLMVIFGGAFYFGIQSLQAYNGKRALEATGLTPLSLQEAFTRAQQEGKPIFANLSAFWCGYCAKLDRDVLADKRVNTVLNRDYIYARIDSESPEADMFKKNYGATGYPTVVLLRPDGTLIKTLDITFDVPAFIQQI